MSTYSGNITTKVNRAISSATTVNSDAYAVVTYIATAIGQTVNNNSFGRFVAPPPAERYFGPGQAIPGTFSTTYWESNGPASQTFSAITVTWTLQSGFEFINTP